MLTRLRVNGFKNLIGVDLHFGPFTCIAGANAVGKSNLFDVILFLKALMDAPIMDAAMAVRGEKGSISDIQHLFTQTAKGICLPIEIEAEMLVPGKGSDYLDQPAEAKTTFLLYRVELRYRPAEGATARPRIELIEETLDYVKKGEAHAHLPFRHSPQWRDSVVAGRRTSKYISTETRDGLPGHGCLGTEQHDVATEAQGGQTRVVKLHQDSSTGGGQPRLFQAEKLPRTVLSSVNAQESPTAVLARQEMLNWRLLQLEPSALRLPDGFDAPSQLAASGAHLPATLYRLSQEQEKRDAATLSPREANERIIHGAPDHGGERALAQIANRLYGLIDHVGQVRIDRDEKRELLTLLLTDKHRTELPAKALSDGTLRFLALATVEIDPTLTGLICMEEPENGIHPERIEAMLGLLRDIAVDPKLPTGEDNPLRQVIINTHSPVVVGQVPDDTLVFAVPEQRMVPGGVIKGVSFRCLSETWRADKAKMPVVAKGKALAFRGLQPKGGAMSCATRHIRSSDAWLLLYPPTGSTMFIRIGFDIAYSFPQPTEMIMMLYTHPSRSSFLMKPERLTGYPALIIEDFMDAYGNKCARAFFPGGRLHLRNDAIMVDGGLPDILTPGARQHTIHELPTDTLLYLLGSRYCEIEKLSDIAWDLFGRGPTGWGRVQSICDWVHNHITFAHESARCDRTAYDTYLDQRGVCRDYTHLAITFCRCMGIPARYATGYLGDIQVPLVPPMDFSAWFEVFLGGQWHTFDARNNQPRVGRILMAQGRDAADVALTTTFGKHVLEKFDIWTYELSRAEVLQALKG